MSAIVVTGTDTGIGKTVFAAALAAALDADYWKPIQAGLDEETDSQRVAELSGLAAHRIHPEAYRLTTPCSPHRAAELDGVTIDTARLTLPTTKPLIIEGAGGVMVPITRAYVYADLLADWAFSTVLVARTTLGTINHSLLSIEALRARRVPLLGIVFIGETNEDTESTITTMGKVKRLGRLPSLALLNRATLAQAFSANFNVADFTA
jgi:dethiobiotin synthetase